MSSLRLLVWLSFFAAFAPGAHAQGAERSGYDALVREAVAEYNAGNWGEARLLFGKAHELSPNARTWRGMGLTDYEGKRYVEAIGALQAALASSVKPLTDEQRAEVESVLERSLRFVAVYTLRLPAGVSELRVDGKDAQLAEGSALRLNPGSHALSARLPSGRKLERTIEVEVGERMTLELEEEEPSASNAQPAAAPVEANTPEETGGRVWTWVAAGGTVACGAATLAFGLLALDAHDDFEQRAAAGQPTSAAKSEGQSYQLLTNIGLGVTAAAAITTAILFVVEGAEDPEERASDDGMQVQLGLGAIAVSGAL